MGNPYFQNDQYLQALCNTEIALTNNYGRMITYSFLFSVFSIITANDALGSAGFSGFILSDIPYLTEFCVLVLGVAVNLLVILAIDVFTIAQMRRSLFSATGSLVPNMRMVHMRGSNAWIDSATPKTHGFSSGFLHNAVRFFAIIWSFLFPAVFISIVLAAQAICSLGILRMPESRESIWITYAGLGLSGAAVFILIITAFVPLRFKFKDIE